jgi:hypothetical protein
MFASPQVAARGLAGFVAGLPLGFAFVPLAFAVYGLFKLRAVSPFLFRFSLLLFAACVLYAINYDIPDTEAYLLQAHVVVALWAVFGAAHGALSLTDRVSTRSRRAWVIGGFAAFALIPLAANWRAADQRGDFASEDYARNLLGGLAPNALLLSDASSSFYFTASWLQFVEGYRPDVVVVGYRALGFPWHLDELETRHPGLLGSARAEVAAYRREKAKFAKSAKSEKGGGDSAAYATSFIAMTRAIVRGNFEARPVYITPDVPPPLAAPWRAAPDGLALRLFAGESLPAIPPRDFSYRPFHGEDPEVASIRAAYASAYCYQGVYQALRGDTAEAVALLRKSLATLPGYPEAEEWLGKLKK